MSLKIDFDELPYDLFKLLELSEDCTTKDVKKAYKKAVLLYHPDKNKNVDDEYFSWISLAHKILSNFEHRQIYLEWKNWTDDHSRLKKKTREKIQVPTNRSFKEINEELNKKHGYKEDNSILDASELSSLMSKLSLERGKMVIPKERISDINVAVDSLKQNKSKLLNNNQNIVSYNGNITTLSNSLKYGSLDDIGKLYGENENIVTNRVTNLDRAFSLSHYEKYIPDNLSLEDKIKKYKEDTKKLDNKK